MKPIEQDEVYTAYKAEAVAAGHRNKCVVIMMAIVTGRPYKECMARLHATLDREVGPTQGYYVREWQPVLVDMLAEQGLCLQTVSLPFVRLFAKTTRSFSSHAARCLGVDTGLILTARHVSAVKDGKVRDWAKGRSKRITCVARVVPIDREGVRG